MTIKAKIVLPFLLLFLSTFALTTLVSIVLVSKAVEHRFIGQCEDLAHFIAQSGGFPLTQPTLEHIKKVYRAEVIVRAETGIAREPSQRELTTLPAAEATTFARTHAPESWEPSSIREIILADKSYDAAWAPLRIQERALKLYLFFPSEILSREKAQAVLPFVGIAAACALLVALIGFLIAHQITKPLSRLAQQVRNFSGGEPQFMEVDKKIAEVARLTESFNEMTAGLKRYQSELLKSERLATMGRMAMSLAHEIRNPLTSLKMNLQMLAAEQSEEARASYELLLREIGRLELATTELMNLGKPMPLQKQPTSLNDLVEETLALLNPQLQHLHVSVVKNLKPLPPLAADPARLKRAVMNLILNGVQATPEGGVLRFSTDRAAQNGSLCFRVQDAGKGIPPEIQPHLFEPFVTTKRDGLGFGLYIAKQIVEEHGGRIGFETSPQGSTFWMELPHG